MARCTICDHRQRHEIEAALAAGASQQQVADRFGLGSRKPLRTHLTHFQVTLRPQPDAPTPEPPDPARPTVAQLAQQIRALEAQRAACVQTVEQLELTQAALGTRLHVARLNERPERWALEDQVAQAQQDLDAAHAQGHELAQQIHTTQRDLTAGQARGTPREQEHWLTVVLPQLEEEFERYCCRLMARQSRVPPTTPAATLQRLGPLGTSQLRVATCQRLRERYPFVEGKSYA
jgi:hypothetical protein